MTNSRGSMNEKHNGVNTVLALRFKACIREGKR